MGLAPLVEDDLDKLWQWINNKQVTQYTSHFTKFFNKKEQQEWLESVMRGEQEETFGIMNLERNLLIGTCSLEERMKGSASLGILIGEPSLWGEGLGSDAVRLLLDYGFNVLDLQCVWLFVGDYNMRAKRCYEKVGFKESDKIRQARHRGGTYHDMIVMDILKEEFNSNFESQIKKKCTGI